VVILGRQQLFTENTLTPVLPVLQNKEAKTLRNMLRLWGVVLLANLLGALAFALVAAKTPAFNERVHAAFMAIGHEAIRNGFGTALLRGIFAGWLIALIVWLLPYAESSHFFVIVVITWLVGAGQLTHVIAGAIEVFTIGWAGEKSWVTIFLGFLVPTLIGNIIGGVTLVAALNHAQVVAGEQGQDV
jgi:formate/nitrite transporter FocA (FNT family)